MQLLTLAEIQPIVRIANYHPVAPGQSWPNRRIPDLQLILLIAGNFEYHEAGQVWALLPGDVLLIEPGVSHTFRSSEVLTTGLISGMHFELTPAGAWAAGDYRLAQTPERITRVHDVAYLQERFRRLALLFAGYLPYRDLLVSAIAREILLILASHWRQPAHSEISPRMQEMIKFIRSNLQRPLSRQVLAQTFALTPAHINLLFRQELGLTPTAVINRERVMTAYRLIHEQGRTVAEAAYAVGFSDPFYFSRVFKSILGIPPSQVQ